MTLIYEKKKNIDNNQIIWNSINPYIYINTHTHTYTHRETHTHTHIHTYIDR